MNTYNRHRFPPDITGYAVWLYYRFNLSRRDIEDLLPERGIIVTDNLRSYGVAPRELLAKTIRSTKQYENSRAEQSHDATRARERWTRRFMSMRQAQRFFTAHAAVSNLFNLGRHLVRAQDYLDLSVSAFREWSRAVAR